ncbi:polyprenyl synthetase family protein [Marinagarivorans algicola]|uniref:polyprenyl synthetase family protein n=1 Tax=Marinagarivorans algicola TaxID=1513270 RepID=UPI0006B5DE33|nr:polyprenyl synthetase family protein [Marinagarivorans algicola]
MLPFLTPVESDFDATNRLIINQLHSDVGLVENIGHYIVDSGGKRLRPILVLLTANALHFKGDSTRMHSLAAIIEFIHTATLLHDDVVDVSDMRRSRLTANAQWGNAPAVLVGDFLYSRAFQMLVKLGSMPIMEILSNTTNIISEGEVQQLVNAKDPSVSEANYLTVIHKKTSALFEAACESAAILAGATQTQRQAAFDFGHHLGMAFQLIDDALDYEGDSETLGKNVGDDLAEGKPTLPLIYAMEHAPAHEQALIRKAVSAGDASALASIVTIVKNCGALDYTHQAAKNHAHKAEQALANLPSNSFTQAMASLAQFAVARSH